MMLRSLLFLAPALALIAGPKTLDFYFIDVEGGQATLVVSPSGQSMLIDAGWRGSGGRDADRIAAAAKHAKIKEINYLVITHYHRDHVGGVPQLAQQMKIGTFIDHGPLMETGNKATTEDFADYQKAIGAAQHLVVKPGDVIPLKGVNVDVLSSAGDLLLKNAQPGAGEPNPLCSAAKPKADDPSENARSVGMLITYGKFRMLDLGDLTWNKELGLVCPNNLIGKVDLYLTTHHGLDQSGPAALVHAIAPRVAIMNNGPHKGGSPGAWQIVKDSPRLEDLWQLHFAIDSGQDHNIADSFIANVDEFDQGDYIKVSAEQDGAFTVYNSRNKFHHDYRAR
jgi:competence protein ComEC